MKLSQSLSKWYKENKRRLPWRANKNPYFIWISEIMLQQTTVTAVIPYFEKFLKAFPTVKDLARADEEKVLALWSGLGYYSRARNLQKAAKEILVLGTFPSTYEKLKKLPGIGPYTAAAIASIAFGESVAAVDGNVVRVISRLFDIRENADSKEGRQKIQKLSQDLINGQDPSAHNQGMMELGATICLPKNPACLICPVSEFCESRKAGTVLQRPVKNAKRKQEPWLWEMQIIRKNGKIALVKSENGSPWLNHLWVFPGKASPWRKSKPPSALFRHSITHHKIFVQLKKGAVKSLRNKKIYWIDPQKSRDDTNEVGVSSLVFKALDHESKI